MERKGLNAQNVKEKLMNDIIVTRDKVYSALKTLIELGWIKKEIQKDDNNKFVRTLYRVQYSPFTEAPEVDSPEVENKDTYKKIKVIDNNKIKSFESWYNLYGKKTTKKQALNYWCKKIKDSDLEDIMKHTKLYVNNIEKRFRLDPIRYLRNDKWLDEVIIKEDSNPTISDADDKYYQSLIRSTERVNKSMSIGDMTPDLLKMYKDGKN